MKDINRIKDDFYRAFDEVNDYVMSAEKLKDADKYTSNVYLWLTEMEQQFDNLLYTMEKITEKIDEAVNIAHNGWNLED